MNADETPLDAAFRAQASGDPAAELRFHERILDAELFLALAAEPEDDRVAPLVFDLEGGRVALAADREERLADFLETAVPYAAMPGRRLAAMLAGQGLGLGLNLGAPSAVLLPASALDWLAERGQGAPAPFEARAQRFQPPRQATPALIAALDAKLAAMAGVIGEAHLVGAEVAGAPALMLVLVGVPDAAQGGVAAGIAEAVRFGADADPVDLAFLSADAPVVATIRSVALGFELPRATPPASAAPKAPGMDPARPPILRR